MSIFEKLEARYNPEHDTGPDAPVPWHVKGLADEVGLNKDRLAALQHRITRLETQLKNESSVQDDFADGLLVNVKELTERITRLEELATSSAFAVEKANDHNSRINGNSQRITRLEETTSYMEERKLPELQNRIVRMEETNRRQNDIIEELRANIQAQGGELEKLREWSERADDLSQGDTVRLDSTLAQVASDVADLTKKFNAIAGNHQTQMDFFDTRLSRAQDAIAELSDRVDDCVDQSGGNNQSQIFNAIVREREYQDAKYGTPEERNLRVIDYIEIARRELNEALEDMIQAMSAAYKYDTATAAEHEANALCEILQAASVCVACLDAFGVHERPDDEREAVIHGDWRIGADGCPAIWRDSKTGN